ncbi:siphovirus Gp157 family protein [Vibrio parahaemolyticus]|uniref:siphovirus Gp157 family protein n=1 Tax=Vibrio parahaemolyticus TaxID=670 RepID=UPI0004010C43|nr:siphovirus Gp157 family protein [Vibrio parahaemolyticus]
MANKPRSMNEIVKQVFEMMTLAKEEGWDDDTIADNFAGLDFTIDEKLMAYRKVMDDLEQKAQVAKAEKKALSDQGKSYGDRAVSLENERKRMLYPLLNLFTLLDINSRKGAYGTFYIRAGTQRLVVDKAKVPARFKRRVVTFEDDNDAIKAALDAGEDLDFAHYETSPDVVALRK